MVFPQLQTGALAQYPIVKRRSFRTIRSECADGTMVKAADAGWDVSEWELVYTDLTEGEAGAIRAFFLSVEGRLGSFTFLDPEGNLLAWSERLSEPVWEKDPLLTVTSGAADPWGTARGWRVDNGANAAQQIRQTVAAPSGLYYCLSVYARGVQPGSVKLLRDSEAAEHAVGPTWKRLVFSGQGQASQDTVTFGLEIPAWASVEIFGLQAEAQTGASAYKKTASHAGVYDGARFADDTLRITATDLGRYRCTLRILHAKHR